MAWLVPGVNILAGLGMLGVSIWSSIQAEKQFYESQEQYNKSIEREKLQLDKQEADMSRQTSRRIAGAGHGTYRIGAQTNAAIDEIIQQRDQEKRNREKEIKASDKRIKEHPRYISGVYGAQGNNNKKKNNLDRRR